jgi:tetratricopeptide (TPR) repeat protein
MEQIIKLEVQQELNALCMNIRHFIEHKEYEKSEMLIKEFMGKYHHAPEPHNLLGLVLEAQGDHLTAMKHFRAAYALDPTYLPAQHNLDHFGTFFPRGKWAYDESDCLQGKKPDQIIQNEK